MISEKLIAIDEPMPPSMGLELQILEGRVDSEDVFKAAEEKLDDLEAFHAFWENRDTCFTIEKL